MSDSIDKRFTEIRPLINKVRVERDELLLAELLLNRHEPMSPHHVGAIRERLGYKTDEELLQMVRTGSA